MRCNFSTNLRFVIGLRLSCDNRSVPYFRLTSLDGEGVGGTGINLGEIVTH
jgi:hypothetical protein